MMHRKPVHVALWILQVLLASLFLFAGSFKLTIPADELARQIGLPALLMRFVSLAEVAGGLGLLLPGLVRVRRELTPIAAAGLIVIMVGAVVLSAIRISLGAAVMPFVVGILLVLVVLGRRGWLARPGVGRAPGSFRDVGRSSARPTPW
ncbi:MAG TPA: DoxX family protein [Longimicrobiaceae bacterium]|nr:DoxX family protein [Longimicrobiaceae bacterium]